MKFFYLYKIFFLYAITVLINFLTPEPIRQIYFISLLISFIFSNAEYLYIAFFVLIIQSPAYLFSTLTTPALPVISLGTIGRDINYFELFIIVSFTKALFIKAKRKYLKLRISKLFIAWVLISIIIFIFSFFYENRIITILKTVRLLLPFTLVFTFLMFIRNKTQLLRIIELFLIFSVFVLSCQLVLFLSGLHLFQILGGSFSGSITELNDFVFTVGDNLSRPLYSTHLMLLNIPLALFYIKEKTAINNGNMLKFPLAFAFISLFTLLLGATRGYLLASSIAILLIIIISQKRTGMVRYTLTGAILILLMMMVVPFFSTQVSYAIERFQTLFLFMQGDVTAGETLIRVTQRLPIVLEKFYHSPIFGYGFTSEFFQFDDGHVAFASILLNSGIVGFTILYFIILKFIYNSWQFSRVKNNNTIYIAISLLSFVIVHSTSFMVFSYLPGSGNYLIFLFLIAVYHIQIYGYYDQITKRTRISNV